MSGDEPGRRPTRRQFVLAAACGALALGSESMAQAEDWQDRPNVLFLMCDQFRADAIAALGNPHIHTPNIDRLVRRGLAFRRAYTTCPVCVAARYTVRTGRQPPTTGIYSNALPDLAPGQAPGMEERCGPYLARAMTALGYRAFGVGKFHTHPWDEDVGYERQIHSEELYGTPEQRARDGYAGFIAREHPEYDWVEALMGERTEMYYMPQMSPLPAHLGVEAWAADRAIELVRHDDARPWFGFVSFVGPHPPLAPPLPYNRMYDPDRMPNPVRGSLETDHMDEQIPWMNHMIWAEDINDPHARCLRARYYGEISYIDACVGRILDAVEATPQADNTLIAFFSDHGDHMGDHGAWQKESFFDVSCRVPFLLSWPRRLAAGVERDDLVCLADLLGIATRAAGKADLRDGVDVLGAVIDGAAPRRHLCGWYGAPGTDHYKVMTVSGDWKHIYIANGGREQLFNLREDPAEIRSLAAARPDVAADLRALAVEATSRAGSARALQEGRLRAFPHTQWPRARIYQFDSSRGVTGFPPTPAQIHYEKH